MDELGFNKIAAAVLVTALGYMFLKEASHMVIHVESPVTPAYALAIPEAASTDGADEPLPFPQAEWVAAMDADKGAKVFKKCTSCHTSEQGGKDGTGPNLYGIVGKAAAQKAGFKYSGAMASSGITWTYEDLDAFLTRPSKYVKGTNMSFVGLKKPEQRAAVIEYLRQASDAPLAPPAPAMVDTAEAPAEGETVIEQIEDAVEDVIQEGVEVVAPEGEAHSDDGGH
ncbi:MAG: c-type cytochrome [Maricaulaceae bacterium]